MKSTGMVRPIDELGRIVIPKEIRKSMNINDRDPLAISVEGDNIILSKYTEMCFICGSREFLIEHKGVKVCRKCIAELERLAR